MTSYLLNYTNWNRLFEQDSNGIEKSKYGEYTFDQLFPDNMITPRKESYTPTLKKMGDDLIKAKTEKRTLSDIKINIESSASAQRPTLKIPAGYTKLDHTYGGGEPSNEFLAKNRGLKMKAVIVEELKNLGLDIPEENIQVVPRPDGKWVADSENESEQYVKVKIEGLLTKLPEPKEPVYPYSIVYSWYQIGDSDKKYILVKGTKDMVYRPLDTSFVLNLPKFKEAVQKSPADITIAGYSTFAGMADGKITKYEFFAFSELTNYVSLKGDIFYYADEESWKKDVEKLNRLTPTQWTVTAGTLQRNGPRLPFTVNAKGFWDLGKTAQADFEHGTGNFNRTLYTLKPVTQDRFTTDAQGREYYSKVNMKQWSSTDTRAAN